MLDVVAIGNATMDAFVQINPETHFRPRKKKGELFFLEGSKIEVESLRFFSGGSATNTAVGFARQGLRTGCLCRLGRDEFGRKILKELRAEKVDTGLLLFGSDATAFSVILTGHGLNRVIFAFGGATRKLDQHAKQINWNRLEKTRAIYLGSLHSSLSLVKRIALFSKKNNILLAWNPGQSELREGLGLLSPILKHVSILFLNGEEAEQLAGRGDYKENMKFLSAFVPLVVVSLGPVGAAAFDGQEFFFEESHPAHKLDSAGAGDAFNSGFLAAVLGGEPMQKCLENGVNNATSVIQFLGAKNNLLYRKKKRK